MRIDGKTLAQQIKDQLHLEVKNLQPQGIHPSFSVILVGHDPGSETYVRQKKIAAESIGVMFNSYLFENNVSEKKLLDTVDWLNQEKKTHGIIVQLPLPPHLNSKKIGERVNPEKDIDGFHPKTKFIPPISEAVLEILKSININPKDKRVVVIGRGETAGKPIANILIQKGARVTVIHSTTKNIPFFTKQADIVVSCVGKANIVTPEMVHKKTVLIGVGLHKGEDGKLCGDYDETKIADKVAYYTPTPGGMGPVNVACLLRNVIVATKNQKHTIS